MMKRFWNDGVTSRTVIWAGALSAGVLLGCGDAPADEADRGLAPSGARIETMGAVRLSLPARWTGMKPHMRQSCTILLAADDQKEEAGVGVLDSWSRFLDLQQGWAVVDIKGVQSADPAQEPVVEPEAIRPWIFITVGGVGAGAEGTEFVVEVDGEVVRFDTHADNEHPVFLQVPQKDGGSRRVKLLEDKHLEITRDDQDRYLLNGGLIDDIPNNAEPPAKARPAGRDATLAAVRAKGSF